MAKYIGRHIPGRPNVVPQNMTGASGLKMLNFLYNQAPRDGTAIGMIQNGFPAGAGDRRARHPVRRQQAALAGNDRAGGRDAGGLAHRRRQSIEDARKKEIVVGATARGGIIYTYPALMNELLGTKFKIVTGYSGGNEINIAMERGEVQGATIPGRAGRSPSRRWLKEKKIYVIAQAGAEGEGPRCAGASRDLVKTDADRQLVDLIMSGAALGRPMATTPDVPEPRLRALRAAVPRSNEGPRFRGGDRQAQYRDRSGWRRDHAEDRRRRAGDAEAGRGTSRSRCWSSGPTNRNPA